MLIVKLCLGIHHSKDVCMRFPEYISPGLLYIKIQEVGSVTSSPCTGGSIYLSIYLGVDLSPRPATYPSILGSRAQAPWLRFSSVNLAYTLGTGDAGGRS